MDALGVGPEGGAAERAAVSVDQKYFCLCDKIAGIARKALAAIVEAIVWCGQSVRTLFWGVDHVAMAAAWGQSDHAACANHPAMRCTGFFCAPPQPGGICCPR